MDVRINTGQIVAKVSNRAPAQQSFHVRVSAWPCPALMSDAGRVQGQPAAVCIHETRTGRVPTCLAGLPNPVCSAKTLVARSPCCRSLSSEMFRAEEVQWHSAFLNNEQVSSSEYPLNHLTLSRNMRC